MPSTTATICARSTGSQDATRSHGCQQEQRPEKRTFGNNINKPKVGIFMMPSWLDYCFEYEAVATRNINNHNNIACL
jgi:hypothetical protein